MKQVQQSKLLVLLQFVTIAGLMFLNFVSMSQQKIITVIDGEGKSITTVSNNMTEEVLLRQIRYYSRKVIENEYDLDFRTVIKSREENLSFFDSNLRAKKNGAGDEKLYTENKLIFDAVTGKYECKYEWIMLPWIALGEYPYYTIFGQVKRTVTQEGYKPYSEIKNIELSWKHLNNRPDPFTRPHDLVLMKIEEVDSQDTKFRKAINER